MKTRRQARAESVAAAAARDEAKFASILQPMVDSGFIGVAEVGIMGQLSKMLNRATLEEDIWASFCQQEYENTSLISKQIIAAHGYRWLYKRWSSPVIKRQKLLLAPPSCTPKDLKLFIQVRYDGRKIYSGEISKELVRDLLTVGKGFEHLPLPVVFGKIEWNFSALERVHYERGISPGGRGLPVKCNEYDETKVEARIHLLRKPDSAMCCLYDSQECCPTECLLWYLHPKVEADETVTRQAAIDTTKSVKHSKVLMENFRNRVVENWPLKNCDQATAIMNKFPYPVRLAVVPVPTVVNGTQFAINRIAVYVVRMNETERASTRTEFSLFASDEEEKKHGVSLLHILSEIQGA